MLTPAQGLAILELQQLLAEWCHELDVNGGRTIRRLITDDCVYVIVPQPAQGVDEIEAFYEFWNGLLEKHQKDGTRTQRHTLTNMRVAFTGEDEAVVDCIIVNSSKEGRAPITDFAGPTVLADARMGCRREADGAWRIARFESTPILSAPDPLINPQPAP